MRDRDVMNLLDQLELFALRVAGGKTSQKDFWLYVFNSMKSGQLASKTMEKHVRYKLKGLGLEPP